MTNMIIVFDTNAYRDLGKNRTAEEVKQFIEQICDKEQSLGYHAMMSTTVAMELIYHLSDNKLWNSYKSCIKAAPAMYLHCGNKDCFRLLPLPEVQISKTFYDIEATHSIITQQAIGQIFSLLSKSTPEGVLSAYDKEIITVHNFIEQAEKTLSDEVQKLLSAYDPAYQSDWYPFKNDESNRRKYLNMVDSDDFRYGTAKAMIIAVGMMLQTQGLIKDVPEYQELDQAAKVYVQNYGASLLFRQRFFKYLASGGFNLTKDSRANYLWDEMILHFAGQEINNEKILLVTSDKNMRSAVKDFDATIPIMSLAEYLQHIGISQS